MSPDVAELGMLAVDTHKLNRERLCKTFHCYDFSGVSMLYTEILAHHELRLGPPSHFIGRVAASNLKQRLFCLFLITFSMSKDSQAVPSSKESDSGISSYALKQWLCLFVSFVLLSGGSSSNANIRTPLSGWSASGSPGWTLATNARRSQSQSGKPRRFCSLPVALSTAAALVCRVRALPSLYSHSKRNIDTHATHLGLDR